MPDENKINNNRLLRAVKDNDLVKTEKLLQSNHISEASVDGNTPLHYAAINKNPLMIALLLQYGEDISKKNVYGETPIQVAAKNAAWDCVDMFAISKSDVDDSGHYGSALHYAAFANKLATVSRLLDAKASLSWCNLSDHNGVLHLAVINKNPEMIALLLENGAKISKENLEGKTAIQLATDMGAWDCVKAFARCKHDVDDNGRYGYALYDAVCMGLLDTTNKLLSANAAMTWINTTSGNGLLHLAVTKQNVAMINLLLKHKAPLDQQNYDGNTPLHLAVLDHKANLISLLLNAGAKLDLVNKENKTASQLALKQKDWASVKEFDKHLTGVKKFVNLLWHHHAKAETSKPQPEVVHKGALRK